MRPGRNTTPPLTVVDGDDSAAFAAAAALAPEHAGTRMSMEGTGYAADPPGAGVQQPPPRHTDGDDSGTAAGWRLMKAASAGTP